MQGKVKCTLVQALRLCIGCTANMGSKGVALLFLDHGTRRGWGVSVTPRPLFTPGKVLVPIVQEAGWAPGPVWTGAENLTPTRIRSPDRPARSQLLYRLCYPAHELHYVAVYKLTRKPKRIYSLWSYYLYSCRNCMHSEENQSQSWVNKECFQARKNAAPILCKIKN